MNLDQLIVIDWQAIAALITLGAVFTALFQRQIVQWLFRPNLVFEFDHNYPYVVFMNAVVGGSVGLVESHWYSVRVKNTGLGTAHEVRVQLDGVAVVDESQGNTPVMDVPLSLMCWANNPAESVTIPRGFAPFMNLGSVLGSSYLGVREFKINTRSQPVDPNAGGLNFGLEYRLDFTIVCADKEPQQHAIIVRPYGEDVTTPKESIKEAHITLLNEGRNMESSNRRWPFGWKWNLSLSVLFLIGVYLWTANPMLPTLVREYLSRGAIGIDSNQWIRLVGIYIVFIISADKIITWILLLLRREFNVQIEGYKSPEFYRPPTVNGMLESVLYPTAIVSGYAEFIGLWLVIKVTSQWKRWGEDDRGRAVFQVFLAGNALSVLFGYLTFVIIRAWGILE